MTGRTEVLPVGTGNGGGSGIGRDDGGRGSIGKCWQWGGRAYIAPEKLVGVPIQQLST